MKQVFSVVACACIALLLSANTGIVSPAPLKDTASEKTATSPLFISDAAGQIGISKVKGLSLGFFSSLSGTEFGRFTVEDISPATSKHGPFVLPAIGFALTRPRLTLRDTPCSARDWASLLETVAAFARVHPSGALDVQLPGGDTCSLGQHYRINGDRLTAVIAQPSGALLLLRIGHDGADHLHIEHHTIPAPELLQPSSPSARSNAIP